MKSALPNLLTLLNLACGILALLALQDQQFWLAAGLVGGSLAADFLDGFVARLLGVHSEVGLQLDSLADVVSFGVVPGFFLWELFQQARLGSEPIPAFLPYLSFLVPLFAALRLARFNVDTRQQEHFLGLPTPALTLFIFSAGLWGLTTDATGVEAFLLHPMWLTVLTLGGAFLLVVEWPLLSFKVKEWTWRANRARLILLAGVALLLLLLRWRALAFIIPLYLLVSAIFRPRDPR